MSASPNSKIKGLTSAEYDRIDLSTLRYWRRYWLGRTRAHMPEDHKDPIRQADEIEKVEREIEARELARRGLAYEEPLMVKLPADLKERLKVEAARSRSDMSTIVRDLITGYVKQMEDERRKEEGRGRRLVEHMTGRATSGMTTDEIMALTRGED